MTIFTASTASTRRFDVTAAFAFRVLQCMQFCNLSLPSSPQPTASLDRDGKSRSMASTNPLMELVHILRGSWRLQAMRCIVSYQDTFGVEEPTFSMMPTVRAARQRAEEEERRRLQAESTMREMQRIVRVQSRVRQLLSRRARLQLALVCRLAVERRGVLEADRCCSARTTHRQATGSSLIAIGSSSRTSWRVTSVMKSSYTTANRRACSTAMSRYPQTSGNPSWIAQRGVCSTSPTLTVG